MLFLCCNSAFLVFDMPFSFYEKPLYISVRIIFSNNKNGVNKNEQKNRK